jgi:hypothetical protein
MKRMKVVGLDVHAKTIAVAVAEQNGEVRALGVIPNRVESIRKLVKKLGPVEQLWFCYEAGPTGYVRVLATDGAEREVRSGGANAGASESGRSGENRSARCSEAGAELSGRRVDDGLGTGCGP